MSQNAKAKAPDQYGGVARFLHWAVAAMIVLQYILAELGEWAEDDGERLRQLALLANHKSVGMTVLMLALLRIGWRLLNPPPKLPATMAGWQKIASHISHWSLYAFLFALPITGWLMSSASNYSVSWFGVFTWPDLVEPSKALRATMHDAHEILAEILFVIALVHIAAAFKHQWIDKDGVLARITSWPVAAVFIVVLSAGAWVLTDTKAGQTNVAPEAVPVAADAVEPLADSSDTEAGARTTEPDIASEVESDPATANDEGEDQPATDQAEAAPAAAGDEPITVANATERNDHTPSTTDNTVDSESTSIQPRADQPVADEPEPEPAPEPEPPTAARWQIDYAQSYIRFTAEQAGASFTGEWQQWDADMRFSADALADSEFNVNIEVSGVDTQDDERDNTLMDAEWFAADNHPTVVFRTTDITRGDDGYTADATLSVKGQRKPVTFRFDVAASGEQRELNGSARLDRLALGIGTGEWTDTEWVGQYVDVQVRVVATAR